MNNMNLKTPQARFLQFDINFEIGGLWLKSECPVLEAND
jgi:hypothetical protein